jgi:hypothetical protein
MNEDTRVAVCCYAGDHPLVQGNLGLHIHHGRPVTILSPDDSRVEIIHPGVENRFGGARAYTGIPSLERQRRHLEILLSYPEKYFFINDADSACLTPELPAYLYAEPDLVWSMVATDADPDPYLDETLPHVAFQPPYFLSRKTIEAMLASADKIVYDPRLLNIDHYMVQLAYAAGLPWRGFEGAVGGHFSTVPEHLTVGINAVKNDGYIFIHGAKTREAWAALIAARGEVQ